MESRKCGQDEINDSSSSHLGLLLSPSRQCSHSGGGGGHAVLLASRMSPGMLLPILQCTGQTATTKDLLVPNANSANLRNPG